MASKNVARISSANIGRTARNVRHVLSFARPHWKGLLLSFALMGAEAYSSMGRFAVLLPVLVQIVPKDAGQSDDPELRRTHEILGGADEKGGTLLRAITGFMRPVNDLTRGWVPDSWLQSRDAGEMAAERERYATALSVFLVFLVFMVLMSLTTYGESYVAERVRLAIVMDVRAALCRVLMDQPVAFYDRRRRGEILQRVLGDVEGYSTAVNIVLKEVAKGLFAILAGLTMMVLLSWKLSLVCLLGLPFLVPLYKLTKKTLKRSHKKQQEIVRRTETMLQFFSGIRTVKAFGTEARRIDEMRASDEEVTRRSLKVQHAKSTADALTEFINNFLAMALAIGGGVMVLRGALDVTVPELVMFFMFVISLYQPLKRLVKQMNNLQDAMACVERTTEWLALPVAKPDRPGAITFPGLEDSIRFEGVGFSYVEGQPVLEGVTFEVPRGATVALVGPSGGGKSTLCDLLLRFYDPTEGRITVDGRDLRDVQRTSFLARSAVVTQTPFLFHATIRDNIRQGKLGATDAEIEAAAKAAQVHDFVTALPKAYDEEVGEMGVRLSGGQRQRITIARALVRDPEILVLDEATSSLDTASEKAVQEALLRLQEGRTTLVVAHRLSTIRHAHRIVVLAEGRVVEQGTHEELISKGGLYADLVRMQDLTPVAAASEDAE
jgi:subfamily B ATP-binding cassette protein MsbA